MGCVSSSSSCKIMAMKLKLKEIHILSGAFRFPLNFQFPHFSTGGGQLADQFIWNSRRHQWSITEKPICSMFKRQCREKMERKIRFYNRCKWMNWLLPKELPIEITDHVLCLSFEWDWYNFFTKPSIGIQYFVVHCFRRAQLLPLSWVELHAIERQTVISATSVIFMQPPNHLSSEPLCSCHITEIILHPIAK